MVTEEEQTRTVRELRQVVFGSGGSPGIDGKVAYLEDVVWKHSKTGQPGLVQRMNAVEKGAQERVWLIRIVFGLVGLQTFLGPEAVATFMKGVFGVP